MKILPDVRTYSFKRGKKTNTVDSAENKMKVTNAFLKAVKTLEDKEEKKPNFWNCGEFFPSITLSFIPLFGYELFEVINLHKLEKKFGKVTDAAAKKTYKSLKNKIAKRLIPTLIIGGIATFGAGLGVYFNGKNSFEKQKQNVQNRVNQFNKDENADLKLRIQPLKMGVTAAYNDPMSGTITVSQPFCTDPVFYHTHAKHLLNHELVHAKQYMLISRLDDGIEKINFYTMKKIATSLGWLGKLQINEMYKEFQNGADEKYKNAVFQRNGYNVNLADYVTAVHTLLHNSDAKEKDIPMVVNKKYYENVRKKQGKLSPEEETKAKEYLKAFIDYPPKVGVFQSLNPKSSYRQNPLEQEAYKMNPWWTY